MMDEKTAWSNFAKTGLVQDYLTYKRIKAASAERAQEEVDYADKHRWVDYYGTEYRGG